MSLSETQLLESALDPEQWVDAYGDCLFRYAHSRLRDVNAAEEVVQETFLAGIRHREQYAGLGTQRGWLMGILRRKIVDFVRARAKTYDSLEEEPDPTVSMFDENGSWKSGVLPAVQPEMRLESQELLEIIELCLERLPPGQADVFVLSVMEEMGTEEICKELQISASNLWVRLHRARLGLAKCVGSKWYSRGEAE